MGAAAVIVTAGGEGAQGFMQGAEARVPAPKVAVADTVGAGDTFMAALIAGVAEAGLADHAALRALDAARLGALMGFCAAAAAVTCGRRGADLPRRPELPPLSL
jgi:fructokinase